MNQNNPLVSIVIPVYNHEEYVEEALSSVFEQTYPHLEVIIIDDGSKDSSVKKIKAYLDSNGAALEKRKVTFLEQPNQGAHNTINRGLKLAKGQYLTILNSDDFYHLRRIELMVSQALLENAEWAFSRVHVVDETGKSAPRGNWWWSWYERCMLQLALYPTIGFKLLQDNITVSTGNLFFSKKLFEEIGEFKDLKLAHDYDFAMRALSISEPLFVREELYFYRLHSNNTAPKVLHLIEKELAEIYKTHLASTYQLPKNKWAPCSSYWPLSYPFYRKGLLLDKGLKSYLKKDSEEVAKKISHETDREMAQKKTFQKGQKITFISHELSLSGAPKLLADIALMLKERGFRPNIISLHDGPMKELLRQNGIKVTVIPPKCAFWLNYWSKWKRAVKLFAAILIVWKNSGNIIISNTSLSWPLALTTCFALRWKRFLWYIHESCGPEALIPGGLGMNLFRKAVRSSRIGFWFGSKATKKVWEEARVTGEVVYWSGMDSPRLPKKTGAILNLLSVGTGEPRKGFHYLVDAFIALAKENRIPEATTLTLVGFSDDIDAMQSFNSDLILKVLDANLANRIHFLAKVKPEKLDDLYNQADLYIQASLMECMPLSVLQAMSRGMPIVSSSADGCAEAIEHKVNGYLFSPRNTKALEKCLEEAINNPDQSFRFGKKAFETFNAKFSKQATEEELIRQLFIDKFKDPYLEIDLQSRA